MDMQIPSRFPAKPTAPKKLFNPMKMSLEVRFWSKVDKSIPDGCWPWTGSIKETGYGQFYFDGKPVKAHRLAFVLTTAPIPKGLDIDHICHNRACVNPAHLRLATRSENLHNMQMSPRNTSGFKGAYWHKKKGFWTAGIYLNGKRIHLGVFHSPEAAHAAYCEAAIRLHGEFANFGSKEAH